LCLGCDGDITLVDTAIGLAGLGLTLLDTFGTDA
jgi:hypothetical protein